MTNLLIVAPAFNEVEMLPDLIDAASRWRSTLPSDMQMRLLIVDDGSSDGTLVLLRWAAVEHAGWLGYVSLSANTGHQAALITGLSQAGTWADAIVTMDADLEHPMEVVPQLVSKWRETGAIVVHAVRRSAPQLPILKRVLSKVFYRITSALTGLDLVPGQADFRLWDAAVLRSVSAYLPHIGSVRVFAAWLPGRKEVVEYEQRVRPDRESRFTFRKNYELAMISIVRFSDVPLKAIAGVGLIGLLFAFSYGVFIAINAAMGKTVPGWSSTVLTVMGMGCLQLIAFGVLANYLRRLVFARDLPPFVIRESRLIESRQHD